MQAFHNKKSIKQKYIKRLEEHYKADEIIHGVYWQDGKGCAVGCTVHSDSHQCYETELGIPKWLALLEDALFEGMGNDKAKEFPLQFLKTIPLGVTEKQFQSVYHKFCVFVLESMPKVNDEKIMRIIADVIVLHKTEEKDGKKWSAVESAVRSAAWSAAWSAVRSAAWSAAWSAAESAESAAESARSAAFHKMADKLLELLKGMDK